MPVARTVQTNFTSGRIDATMLGRIDTSMYRNGGEVLDNWELLVQGGITRRRGMPWLSTFPEKVRLIEFIFNELQTNILALAPGKIYVYDMAGTLHQTISAGVPWTTQAMVDDVRFDQRGDTVIFTRGFQIQKLLRTAANTFTLSDFEFEKDSNGVSKEPYFKYADPEVTISFSAASGTITVTASTDVFTSDHVGAFLKRTDSDTPAIAEITVFLSATQVTAVVKQVGNAGATDEWLESAFSDERGWPQAVAFHAGRLWLAGSTNLPSHIFGSRTSAFFNFDPGSGEDAEAIGGSVATGRIGAIKHLTSSEVLFVISDNGLAYIPETDAQPVTPSSFNPRFVVPQGASNVPPVIYDEAISYPQNAGRAVREVIRDEFTLRVKTRPVSFVATDIVRTIVDSSAQYWQNDRPESFAYFVNSDGTIAIYHALRTEDFAAWTSWSTSGRVISLASVNEDLVACVERQINGVATYFFEKFASDYTLDSARRYMVTTASNTFTLDSRLVGAEIAIVSLEENVISNGAFDDATGWTLGTGWSVSGGTLVGAAGSASTATIGGLTLGKRYRIEGKVTTYTAGQLTIDCGYDATLGAISRVDVDQSTGTFSVDLTCNGDTNLYLRKDSAGDLVLDDVCVRELDANDRIKILRRYLGTATVGVAGALTLPNDWTANHIEVGFNYIPTAGLLPVAEQAEDGNILTEPKRVVSIAISCDKVMSLTVNGTKVQFLLVTQDFSLPVDPFTGVKEVYNLGWDRVGRIPITMPEPLPGTILATSREVIW